MNNIKINGKNIFDKFFDWNNYVLRKCTFFLYIAFTVLGFYQIISRYILNRPIIWGEQMSRFMFIWSIFLGSALVFGEGEHIALSFFKEKYSKDIYRYINIVKMIILLFVVVWLFIIDGYKIVIIVHKQISPAMKIPMSIPYSAIFFGGISMALNILAKLVKELQNLFSISKERKI